MRLSVFDESTVAQSLVELRIQILVLWNMDKCSNLLCSALYQIKLKFYMRKLPVLLIYFHNAYTEN